MLTAAARTMTWMIGLALAAAACLMATPSMLSIRGVLGPTILAAHAPGRAAVMMLAALAAATIVAIVVTRLANAAVGLFVLGGGLCCLAMRLATVRDLAFGAGADHPRAALLLIAAETFCWFLALLAASAAVFRFGGPLHDIEPLHPGKPANPFWSPDALKSATAGLIALPIVWVIAQSPAKGQMLGAVFCGAMMAGLFGRLIAPNVQPVLLFASPALFGALGQALAAVMIRVPLDAAFVDGKIPNLGLPMPIDYAAGSLLGVSIGLGCAKSFLQHEEASASSGAAAASASSS